MHRDSENVIGGERGKTVEGRILVIEGLGSRTGCKFFLGQFGRLFEVDPSRLPPGSPSSSLEDLRAHKGGAIICVKPPPCPALKENFFAFLGKTATLGIEVAVVPCNLWSNLPDGQDGEEVIAALKKTIPSIKIVALSNSQVNQVPYANEVDRFVPSFQPTEIARAVGALLPPYPLNS